jgi:hypothetical protein
MIHDPSAAAAAAGRRGASHDVSPATLVHDKQTYRQTKDPAVETKEVQGCHE